MDFLMMIMGFINAYAIRQSSGIDCPNAWYCRDAF
jgi:hypothetical protein